MSTKETTPAVHLIELDGLLVDDLPLSETAHTLQVKFGVARPTVQLEPGDPAHSCSLASEKVA